MASHSHADATREAIRAGAALDVPYLTMNALAAVIASYGLLANSPAVVIGAMIVAMLLGPIAGAALAVVDGDARSLVSSLATLVAGAVVVGAAAFIIGLVHRDLPLTHEILARTAPNVMDLMIALAGGAAGAYASVSRRLSGAVVGVAIATALAPPICAGSLLIARGDFELGFAGYFLAFANIVAIEFAFAVVLWLNGYRGVSRTAGLDLARFLRRNLLSLAVLAVLAVVLSINLHRVVVEQVFASRVRVILDRAASRRAGMHVTEVQITHERGATIIWAVVRGPAAPTVADVAALNATLPPAPDRSAIDLRVRFIDAHTITAHGLLYEPAGSASPGMSPATE